jgi:SlyX protein
MNSGPSDCAIRARCRKAARVSCQDCHGRTYNRKPRPMTDTAALEARIVELESRLAHFERMAEDLSAVMAEQGRALDLVTLQCRRLVERVRELEAGPGRSPQDEPPPPHY